MTRTILLAEIMHETNTFNRIATRKADFLTRYWLEGAQVGPRLAGTNTEVCGFLDAAAARGWTVETPLAASASPSGPMAADDWEEVKRLILAPLRAGRRFDAVVLVLHGAMVTQTSLDPEGELLGAVRALAGPDTVVAATLDMHANVSAEMVAAADLMMAYRTYPHVDQYERAQHMTRLLERVLDGGEKPKLVLARRAMMDAANHGQTAPGQPMPALLARADAIEQRDGVLCASLQIGFPWADVADQGPSVVITALDAASGQAAADELAEALWDSRHQTQLVFATPDEGIAAARTGHAGGPPLVLADFADNPAGGAYGDSPNLLRAMVRAGLSNAAFATVCCPETVAMARAAGAGAEIDVRLGGRGAPQLTPPFEARARVVRLGDGDFVCAGPMWKGVAFSMGASAVLEIGGVAVIVSSVPTSVMDLNVFRSMGIEPETHTTLAVKSRNHFKAAYGPIARDTLLVDAGGIASMRLAELDYRNIRRPVWPLDEV